MGKTAPVPAEMYDLLLGWGVEAALRAHHSPFPSEKRAFKAIRSARRASDAAPPDPQARATEYRW